MAATQPSIAPKGVMNAASLMPTVKTIPTLAPGTMFVVFGDSLGPDPITVSTEITGSESLAGTSIEIRSGEYSFPASLVYTSRTQAAALMPSSIPLGDALMALDYNGTASAPVPIRIVSSSFGIFTVRQNGAGAAIAFNQDASVTNLNDRANSAFPGQVVQLWGTGLDPLSLARPTEHLKVFFGNRYISPAATGPVNGLTGIEQVAFVVPDGLEGCSVPVAVVIDGLVSNFVSISVSSSPNRICKPVRPDVAGTKPGESFATTLLTRSQTSAPPGFQETMREQLGVAFQRLVSLPPGLPADDDIPTGACSASLSSLTALSGIPIIKYQYLNAGAAVTIDGPNGTIQALPTLVPAGFYSWSAQFVEPGGPFPIRRTEFFVPGTYRLAAGGPDIDAFEVPFSVPAHFEWTNRDSFTTIDRSQGALVSWKGGDPSTEYVVIQGLSGGLDSGVGGVFVCRAQMSAGQFEIPEAAMLLLPPAGGVGSVSSLTVQAMTTTQTIQHPAQKLDLFQFQYTDSFARPVTYR